MFDIKTDKFGEFVQYKLINNQSGEYVSVVPANGANVTDLVLKCKDVLLPVISGYNNAESLKESAGYRSSRLMPFPNRIERGQYQFDGISHQLEINRPKEGHAIHGLFYDKAFEVDRFTVGPSGSVLDLYLDYNGDNQAYPFPFRAELSLKLTEGGFKSSLVVINTGNTSLPFGDGWHPYFTLNGRADDWFLKIPQVELLELNDHKIPTGKMLSFNGFTRRKKIEDLHLDVALHLNKHDNKVAITEIYDKSADVHLQLWQETGPHKYNYIQIYIPASRDCIALEPMTCAPNAFNNKKGLIVLEPDESFQASYGVSLG